MQFYTNDTIIPITEIGETDGSTASPIQNSALQCITDKKPCCRTDDGPLLGHWYFPSGEVVGDYTPEVTTFYRNRGPSDGTVNLNHINPNIMSQTGLFCCIVPDAADISQTLCVNISKKCIYLAF